MFIDLILKSWKQTVTIARSTILFSEISFYFYDGPIKYNNILEKKKWLGNLLNNLKSD